jgi:pyruvate dehydrogenase E2 component (dihydrolipoamide acetyltransferase)
MAEVIRMPKMSDTMTEGVIVAWHKKVGDDVKPGDILAEVETDKATMELENYVKGTLLHIGIEKGKAVPVDAVIAVVGKKGEDFSALLDGDAAKKEEAPEGEGKEQTQKPEEEQKEQPKEDKVKEEKAAPGNEKKVAAAPAPKPAPPAGDNNRVKASPLAKRIAAEKGVELTSVSGSGDNGRIIKRDVENYTPGRKAVKKMIIPPAVTEESFTENDVSQMRKAIARRLLESKNGAPHFYLTMAIVMDKAIEVREALNEISPVKISVNDVVLKAVAVALRMHPNVNSSWLGDRIRINHHIHIGVAVAIDDGLIVPVIRFADSRNISDISREVKSLAEKARNKKLAPEEYSGNTFTISNLGMYGIDEFTAIINPPDSCILAIGAAKETVIADNGSMRVAQVMKVTLSCDHRAVDGAVGSAFLQTLKSLLENPVKFLVQV